MRYLSLYLYHFFVPGLLLAVLLGFRRHVYLLALSFSYLLLVGDLAVLKYLGSSVTAYGIVIHIEVASLLALVLGRAAYAHGGVGNMVSAAYAGVRGVLWADTEARRATRWRLAGALITAFGTSLYLRYAGPYTELPSDAWWHLAGFQEWFRAMAQNDGRIEATSLTHLLAAKRADYWYFIHAYLSRAAGIDVGASIVPLTVANTLTFMLAIYGFGLFVFENGRRPAAVQVATALVAAALVALHFGINVFAYVRYYVFAPAFLNYVVYLATLVLVVDYLNRGDTGARNLMVVALLLPLLGVLHQQEAYFAAVLIFLVALVTFVYRRGWRNDTAADAEARVLRRRARGVFGVLLVSLLVAIVATYAVAGMVRHTAASVMVFDLSAVLPLLDNLYILNPIYQPYQVFTAWGILVYALFLLRIREFRGNAYLVAGMLLPVVTVFNPLFVDFFLRYSWPEVLWRILFAVPLPFVGAWLIVQACAQLRRGAVRARVVAAMTLVALIGLLLPLNTQYLSLPYSRLYSLRKVPAGNSERLWADLVTYLQSLESPRSIITDPVTGYMIKGTTGHVYHGYKFYMMDFRKYNYRQYDADTFAAYPGWLLIINRRDGDGSVNGRISRHWPEGIMRISGQYLPELDRHVTRHPELFQLLWERDRIRVYEIRAGQARPA